MEAVSKSFLRLSSAISGKFRHIFWKQITYLSFRIVSNSAFDLEVKLMMMKRQILYFLSFLGSHIVGSQILNVVDRYEGIAINDQ
jgi:hypothetical protein